MPTAKTKRKWICELDIAHSLVACLHSCGHFAIINSTKNKTLQNTTAKEPTLTHQCGMPRPALYLALLSAEAVAGGHETWMGSVGKWGGANFKFHTKLNSKGKGKQHQI